MDEILFIMLKHNLNEIPIDDYVLYVDYFTVTGSMGEEQAIKQQREMDAINNMSR